MSAQKSTRQRSAAVRWILGIVVFVIGFFAYWLSDLFLDKYIGFGTSWIIVGVMAVIAFVVWIVDERRLARESVPTGAIDGDD